jgi:hypothetical protein
MIKGILRFSTVGFVLAVAASIAAVPSRGSAQSAPELLQRIEALEQQLQDMQQVRQELEALKAQLKAADAAARQAEEQARAAGSQAQAAQKQAQAVERQAREAERADTKWHLAGYASTGFKVTDKGDEEDTFLAGAFNPIFHWQYKDLVLFEGELVFEVEDDGETAVELEYTTIDLLLHDYATFKAGKFLSPIGQFQTRLHPTWINKLPDAPAGFGHGGVQPLSDVGVMLTGGFPLGPLYLANYTVFGGNGPRFEFHEGELEALELEGFGKDDDGNKSFGGRIGILPIPHLEIGGSFMTADVEGRKEEDIEGPVTDSDFTLWGVDASYTRGPFDIRFEYLNAELDSFFSQVEPDEETELVPTTDFEAWYVQAAYQIRGLTNVRYLRNLEPVIRYGEVDAEGFHHFVEHLGPEDRFSIGLNYLFGPSIIAKLGVSWRDFEDDEAEDATEILGQLAYGF